jgi:hypothetical protein
MCVTRLDVAYVVNSVAIQNIVEINYSGSKFGWYQSNGCLIIIFTLRFPNVADDWWNLSSNRNCENGNLFFSQIGASQAKIPIKYCCIRHWCSIL